MHANDEYDTPWKDAVTRYFPEYDRYRRPVASLALLADGNKRWKPQAFDYKLFGCQMGIRFPVAKLNDYVGRLDELLVHPKCLVW